MSIATRRYLQVEKMIYATAWKFKRKFGGDIDEIISEANLIYAQYAPLFRRRYTKKGHLITFAQYIHYFLWKRLEYPLLRKKVRHNRIAKQHELSDEPLAPTTGDFDPHEWMKALSDEAKFVVNAVLEIPIDLRVCLVRRDSKSPAYSFRCALREYLRDLGWSVKEVSQSFKEITGAL